MIATRNGAGAPPPARSAGFWLFLALAAVAFQALPSLLYPFGRDQAMFAYIGDRWLHGELPYRDAWDIKPPGVFAVYALAQLLFGRHMAAARALDIVSTLLTVTLLFHLARRWVSASRAAVMAALFGVAYFGDFDYWQSAQAESFAAPLAVGCVLLLLGAAERRAPLRFAAAGLCLGALVVLKTTFVLLIALAAPALWRWFRSRGGGLRRWQAPATLLAGFLTPLGILVLYFAAHGALPYLAELLEAQKGYAGDPFTRLPARLVPNVLMFFAEHPFSFLLAAATALGIRRGALQRLADWPMLAVWLGAAALLLLLQGWLFQYHWLPLLPVLALGGGYYLTLGLRPHGDANETDRRWRRDLAICVILVPLLMRVDRFVTATALVTGRITRQDYWMLFQGETSYAFQEDVAVAKYVREHSAPEDRILVYAFEPAIYYLSERASPTRHLSTAPLVFGELFPDSLRRRWRAEQRREVELRPPRLLILPGFPDPKLERLWRANKPVVVNFGKLRFTMVAEIGGFILFRHVGAPGT